MIFIGESDALMEVFTLARKCGVVPVEQPGPDLTCVVADEDVLDGECTPGEADILRQVWGLGMPCVRPGQAHALLASAVNRPRLATA
jgi:hypothetical protein